MSKKILLDTTTIIAIILFLYTGISKLFDFSLIKEQLTTVPLFSTIYPVIALTTPIGKIIIAVLLFWPTWRLKGLYAALMAISLFTVYIVYLLILNTDPQCSCGGIIEFISWNQHLLFNMGMIILLIKLFALKNNCQQFNLRYPYFGNPKKLLYACFEL